jgi:hypothetical protein
MKHLLTFLFAINALIGFAQNGIVAIARYEVDKIPTLQSNPPLPEFRGGFDSLKIIFNQRFNYNDKIIVQALSTAQPREGIIGFTVNEAGQIIDIQLIDSTDTVLDNEAIRVLETLNSHTKTDKTTRFSVAFDPFPDWRWREYEVAAYNREQQAMRQKVDNTPAEELEKLVDDTRRYWSGNLWLGQTTTTPPLSKYLSRMGQFGFSIERTQKKWWLGGHFQVNWGNFRKDFEAKDYFWQRDTSFSSIGVGVATGWRFNGKKLMFTPFISYEIKGMSVSSGEEGYNDSPTLVSALPSAGFLLDYKFAQKTDLTWAAPMLNTAILRFRVAVNWANFGDNRRGSLIDVGIGIGGFQRALK